MNTNRTETEAFISAICGSINTQENYKAIGAREDGTAPERIGSFADVCSDLEGLARQGKFPTMCINRPRNGVARDREIVALRALYVDFDDGRTQDQVQYHLEPSFTVTTGRGFHAYWLLAEGAPVSEGKAAQKKLLEHYGSDETVVNLSRMMRLPGFVYSKDGVVHADRLVSMHRRSGKRYDFREVLQGLAPAKIEAAPSSELRGEVLAYLNKVPQAKQGERNKSAYVLAKKHHKWNLTPAEMLPYVLHWNAKNTPPLPVGEVKSIVDKIHRSYTKDPKRYEEEQYEWKTGQPQEAEGMKTPEGWEIADDGIFQLSFQTQHVPSGYNDDGSIKDMEKKTVPVRNMVLPFPFIPTRRCLEVHTERVHFGMEWKLAGKWHKRTAAAQEVFNFTKLLGLADYGLYITSSTPKIIVQFLQSYALENINRIPEAKVSCRMGWVGDGYLLGEQWIGSDKESIGFMPGSDGDTYLAKGISQKGTLQGWKDAVRHVQDYPRVLFGVIASLAAPMLELLGTQGFAVDWSHETSSGKTTTTDIATSAWGKPSEYLVSWASSEKGIRNAAVTRCDMPLVLGDTKDAQSQRVIRNTVYGIANSEGVYKALRDSNGSRGSENFRTILLSTGEERLVDMTKDGGAEARVVTLWGPPFGEVSDEAEKAISAALNGISGNYGMASIEFLNFLVANKDRVQGMRRLKEERATSLKNLLPEGVRHGPAGRVCDKFAHLMCAEELISEALDMPWIEDTVLEVFKEGLQADVSSEDEPALARKEQALADVLDWAQANMHTFYDKSDKREPNTWSGIWKGDYGVSFFRTVLEGVLSKFGYEPKSIIRLWAEAGILERDKGRIQKKVRHETGRYRVLVFSETVTREHFGADEDEAPRTRDKVVPLYPDRTGTDLPFP